MERGVSQTWRKLQKGEALPSFIHIFCDTMFRVVDFAKAIPHMKATLIVMTLYQMDVKRWRKILVIEIRRSARR